MYVEKHFSVHRYASCRLRILEGIYSLSVCLFLCVCSCFMNSLSLFLLPKYFCPKRFNTATRIHISTIFNNFHLVYNNKSLYGLLQCFPIDNNLGSIWKHVFYLLLAMTHGNTMFFFCFKDRPMTL